MTKVVVLLPTYNNDKTLKRVIDGILTFTQDLIIINDGCTDSTSDILASYPQVHQINKSKNEGKGRALLSGFQSAIELGYDHAITIDSDGQHFPEDLPQFFSAIEHNPDSVIIGARNMDQEGIPKKSTFGHKNSNFWFWLETGVKLPDTQTGYRSYPLKHLKGRKYFTTKYELEIEIIVRLAWKGVPFQSVPVRVLYSDERVTHFRPFKDFVRVSLLNVVLVTLTLAYHLHVRIIRNILRKGIWNSIKEHLYNPEESSWKKAQAIGLGLFMSSFPVWGFQMIICVFLSMLFKLNKGLVLLFANISIAPVMPFILYLSFVVGGLIIDQPITLDFSDGLTLEDMGIHLTQYLIGSVALSVILGVSGLLLSYPILKIYRKK